MSYKHAEWKTASCMNDTVQLPLHEAHSLTLNDGQKDGNIISQCPPL